MSNSPGLTRTQWLICVIASIGFAFDIYELLMLPLIIKPAMAELSAPLIAKLVADGKCYVGDEDGDLVVLAATKEGPKVLSEVNMGSPVYSTAVVANGTMYLGSQTHLFAIGAGAKPVEPGAKAAAK